MPSFGALSDVPLEELLIEARRESALSVIKPSFENDLKWFVSDGESRFHAVMKDATFLSKLDKNEVRFGKGDVLIVELFSRSFRTAKGLKTEHIIEEVKDIRSMPKQGSLLPPPEEG